VAFSTTPVHQATAIWSSGSSVVVTVSAPAANNLLVAHYGGAQNSVIVSSISQTNVTWAGATDVASHTNRTSEIWSGLASGSAGTSVTINLSTTPSLASASVSEWSGNDTSSFRGPGAANAGTSTTPTTASITPAAGREALFIFGSRLPSNYSSGPTGITGASTGPSRLTQADTRTEQGYAIVTSTSGSYSAAWVCATSSVWDTTIAAYYAPATATASLPRRIIQAAGNVGYTRRIEGGTRVSRSVVAPAPAIAPRRFIVSNSLRTPAQQLSRVIVPRAGSTPVGSVFVHRVIAIAASRRIEAPRSRVFSPRAGTTGAVAVIVRRVITSDIATRAARRVAGSWIAKVFTASVGDCAGGDTAASANNRFARRAAAKLDLVIETVLAARRADDCAAARHPLVDRAGRHAEKRITRVRRPFGIRPDDRHPSHRRRVSCARPVDPRNLAAVPSSLGIYSRRDAWTRADEDTGERLEHDDDRAIREHNCRCPRREHNRHSSRELIWNRLSDTSTSSCECG
jgi:hypothetical protein